AAKPITSGEHYLYRHVAWTPDGRILYASNIGNSRDIWIMNGDATEPKQLTANAGVNLQPQPSADGRYIVFSSNRSNEGAFTRSRAGHRSRYLTRSGLRFIPSAGVLMDRLSTT